MKGELRTLEEAIKSMQKVTSQVNALADELGELLNTVNNASLIVANQKSVLQELEQLKAVAKSRTEKNLLTEVGYLNSIKLSRHLFRAIEANSHAILATASRATRELETVIQLIEKMGEEEKEGEEDD